MTFSEFLGSYIEKKQIKWLRAAKSCQVDRSTIKRYAKGHLPRTFEQVKNIATGLGMDDAEREMLCHLWKREKLTGIEAKIELIMEKIFLYMPRNYEVSDIRSYQKLDLQYAKMQQLQGKEEVMAGIAWMIQSSESVFEMNINVTMQEQELQALLLQMVQTKSVRQVLEINENTKQELVLFEALVPLFFEAKDYQVYCHYYWRTKKEGIEDGLNFIVSNDMALLFEKNMESGIFSTEPEVVNYYKTMFRNGVQKTKKFGESRKEPNIGCQSTDMQGQEKQYLEYCESATNICARYEQTPIEGIWVYKGKKASFYLQEIELVNTFKEYIQRKKGECVNV